MSEGQEVTISGQFAPGPLSLQQVLDLRMGEKMQIRVPSDEGEDHSYYGVFIKITEAEFNELVGHSD